MPMIRHLYPENWEAIALEIKTAANWHCEECGRPCLQPKEKIDEFEERLEKLPEPERSRWLSQLWEYWSDDETGEWGHICKKTRFILTTAHLDHNPPNCDRTNLKALCAPCHLRYDVQPSSMAKKRRLKLERNGQLNLLEVNNA
jgi:hypothetical protein